MIQVPISSDSGVMADWAEVSCLLHRDVSLSRSEVDRVLDQAAVYSPEATVGDIWQEISRRHDSGGSSYPVDVENAGLRWPKGWETSPAYTFQLLVACLSHYPEMRITGAKWNKTSKLFERLTNHAIGRYVGGEAANIGFPREGSMPKSFRECLKHVSAQMGERRGHPDDVSKDSKDEGVDSIAWRPFLDKRPGQKVILLQCAAGSDWKDKAKDVSVDTWKGYVDWAVSPTKGFAFPFVCPDPQEWRRLSKEGGILLDRLRITYLFSESPDSMITSQLVQWCKEGLGPFVKMKI